jgi:4-hydroxybenzoate polyprenyltransferase
MNPTAPKATSWWIALILGVLGLLGYLGNVSTLREYAFWLVLAGLVLMLVATQTRNL